MNIPTDDELYADYVECMSPDHMTYEQWQEASFDRAITEGSGPTIQEQQVINMRLK